MGCVGFEPTHLPLKRRLLYRLANSPGGSPRGQTWISPLKRRLHIRSANDPIHPEGTAPSIPPLSAGCLASRPQVDELVLLVAVVGEACLKDIPTLARFST